MAPAAAGNWSGQVALCAWHFGALRSEVYSAGFKEVRVPLRAAPAAKRMPAEDCPSAQEGGGASDGTS